MFEKMRDNWTEFSAKAIQNGVADSQFFWKHKDRRWSIATHPLRNYIIKITFKTIIHGRLFFIPYPIIYGFLRQYGFIKGIVQMFFGESTMNQVGKT